MQLRFEIGRVPKGRPQYYATDEQTHEVLYMGLCGFIVGSANPGIKSGDLRFLMFSHAGGAFCWVVWNVSPRNSAWFFCDHISNVG